ncbi:MAG: CDP-diacylglycerol--glycerol-3-phosphate 3-phosphatidyltransferase [Oceanicaulis sp.]|jgi:CDP-diacylglycerol--glycerol-3-phosphate 3-phosphatidyltransferase|nr:CDP-diacylglycerol--glycerol-3-phosphate 3-phosphatidyltransferase [Oceanicaulis sp.]MBC39176.1 CDP-diacylglycerol--glycerol-3-phosphate 3-phosphatidyltransferase [Oceanicaulis sp.]MBG34847.1 CDP-diacylglycerol--glycerol-3-phosphate 3-phosphatidyltransferase [Oceanicaulis sp.]HBU62877.1 CDP-diacylglycerol--glycerol-3-phosphate 3-phosphatidyltransferase [Oceanicaulis sp.]HCR94134.1 CDP-diacylglycerol--glycerol-3-phosphate 3-phosphatidyltransferase [Oceanicaulis sp.]
MSISMNSVLRQLPNILTIGRALAGVIGGWVLVQSSLAMLESDAVRLGLIAAAVFVVAALTDWLDGWLARAMGAQSALGALLDPIADKVLVGGYLIAYCVISGFDAYLVLPVIAIIGRDAAITALRFILPSKGALTVTSTAKIKTALQMVITAAPFVLVMIGMTDLALWYHYWVGAVWFLALLTVWSARPYVLAAFKN